LAQENLFLTSDIDVLSTSNYSSVNCTIYNQLPPVDEGTIQTTARHRHIDLLKFLISRKAPIDEDAMYDAIVRGFTDIVELLYSNYQVIDENCITLAKFWNRHDILKFFESCNIISSRKDLRKENHIEYNTRPFEYHNGTIQRILYHACSHGELNVVKNYRGSLDIKLIPTLQTISAVGYVHDHKDMFYVAILHGQFEIIKFLESKRNYKHDSNYIACAVRTGRIDLTEYLYSCGYSVCEKAMKNAIEKCRLDLVMYLIKNNAPIPKDALILAKKYNADDIYNHLRIHLRII
jgi:hypothetical protein